MYIVVSFEQIFTKKYAAHILHSTMVFLQTALNQERGLAEPEASRPAGRFKPNPSPQGLL